MDDDAAALDEHAKFVEVRGRLARLTPREREVVHQVLDGRLNREIAVALGITIRTVKMHRTAIRKKLGIRSVVRLATLAYDARFFEPIPVDVASEQRVHRP